MNKKIFIVDDDLQIRLMLGKVFKKDGYEVRSAESAEEALEILEKEKYQVMFLDLKLPKMNGVELCRRIRKNNPIGIIYAVTGYASLFELADCREAGFDDYFKKPVEIKILLKAAQDAYDKIGRWKKR
jgi:DNA-binding response OmpR family regulator